jgi:hypothetical protein
VLELVDWSGYRDTSYLASTVAAAAFVNGPIVPDHTMRLVVSASIGDANLGAAVDRTVWMGKLDAAGAVDVAQGPAFFVPAASGALEIAHGLERKLLMLPGERLRGHRVPATLAGEDVRLRQEVIDFPLFEANSIPPV